MRTVMAERESQTDERVTENPEPAEQPAQSGTKKRWRWPRFGGAFLGGPVTGGAANQWLGSCGQGG